MLKLEVTKLRLKNTMDNSKAMKKYADMLEISWPKETLRPKMPLKDRAKIFLPFAALKGYEESLDAVRQIVESDNSDAASDWDQY